MVILVAYLAMLVVWPFLGPLAWAAILAVTLRPVYMRFCIRLSNSNAALATTLLAAVVIIAPAAFLVAVVAQQVPLALDYLKNLSATTPEQVMRVWTSLRLRAADPAAARPDDACSPTARRPPGRSWPGRPGRCWPTSWPPSAACW